MGANVYAGFFAKKIIGSADINLFVYGSLLSDILGLTGTLFGEAVVDDTGAGLGLSASGTLNDRLLEVTGDLPATTVNGDLMQLGSSVSVRSYDNGSSTIIVQNPAWFEDLPFENDNGTTYYVYASHTAWPIDVGVAQDLSRGYSRWARSVGFTVNPDSVVEVSGRLRIYLDAALTDLGMQRWLTSNTEDSDWSYDCAVWLDTTQEDVTIHSDNPTTAIALAKLTKVTVGNGWVVDLNGIGDGMLGQTTASTTATHYKVTIFGPIITDSTDLQTDDDYLFIGTSTSGGGGETIDTTGQTIVSPFSVFARGFGVEHVDADGDDLGRHLSVTAPVDQLDLPVSIDSASNGTITFANLGGGNLTAIVDGTLQVDDINSNGNDVTVTMSSGSAETTMTITNPGASHYAKLIVNGNIEASTNADGPGDITAGAHFNLNPATVGDDFSNYDASKLYTFGATTQVGTGTLAYNPGGGALAPYIELTVGIAAVKTIMVPIDPPEGMVIESVRCRHNQSAAGTPNIRVAVVRWDETTAAFTNVTGYAAMVTRTGAWVVESVAFGVAAVISKEMDKRWYLVVELTNDGIGVSTSLLHKVTLVGTPSRITPYAA